MRYKIVLGFGLLISISLALFTIATECTTAEEQRQRSIDTRADMFARAEVAVPIPYTVNFPLREVLAEYTRRQDLVNRPWFTYIMSDVGTVTHYFVSTTVPVNSCAFLSSTEDEKTGVVLTAPSLDGIYYGGSGAAATCNGWIFIDAATGAMGLVFGAKILTFDAPLILETEPLLIQPVVERR